VKPILRSLVLLSCAACGGAGVRSPVGAAPAPVNATGARAATAPAEAGPPAASEEDAEVPISPRNASWGSRTAPVTIVEFGDLECPFCARAEATLARVRETYGPQAVRIVWKNNPMPFHPNARPAAEAAAGVFTMAGSDAFWTFYSAALRAERPLGQAAYEQWAGLAGVADLASFRERLSRHEWAAVVESDAGDARSLGVFGTPTFFVNGVPLTGALPFPTFQALIEEQLRLAREKLAAGTPPDRLYAELVRDNRAKNAPEQDDDDDARDAKVVYDVPVGKSPTRGSPAALVTIVEFADYQCPFCVRAEPTLQAVRQEYGDKLRIVFKDMPLPFHDRAEPAAEAALEVRAEKGDSAFWAMHDALLSGPPDLGDAALVQLATGLGARGAAVKAAISGHVHRRLIEADADLAEDFEANGTPHFFINGRRLAGAQPKERFEAVIDEELKRAQELLATGVKPADLYDALVRDGKGPPPLEQKPLPAALPQHDPSRGPASAKVTVHEWSDFQCPFCKRAQPTIEQVLHEYGPRVRLVWHDLPLPMHPDAPIAARAAREALAQKGDHAFWLMHDAIFAHQQELDRGQLDGVARSIGLDAVRWAKALDGDAHADEVDADRRAADSIDITGTPAFVIVPAGSQSGYFIGGAQGFPRFRRVIERALAEAK